MSNRHIGGVALVLLLACSNPLGPMEVIVPSWIAFDEDGVELSVPEAADAGESFEVAFTVYVAGCEGEPEDRIDEDGRDLHIRPFDHHQFQPGHEWSCPDRFGITTRRVTLSVGTPGQSTITLHGRSRIEGDTTLISVSRTIDIR